MFKRIKNIFASKWIEIYRSEKPHFDALMSGYVWLVTERHKVTGQKRSRYSS
jgi:hypothetical protein